MKKIVVLYILMLMIATAVLPASETIGNDGYNFFNETGLSNYPSDFELIGYSISNDTWNDNYKLEINNDGLSKYYCMYHENREKLEWTLIKEFTISEDAMDEIWNEISDNDFFNLDDLYESPISESGGDFAKLTITGNGQTHSVKIVNIVVPKFDRIILKINMLTPEDSNLIYNALFKYKSNSPPFKPDKPSGETNGKNGNEYEYSTSCIDPEFNKVWYLFDWGDGTDSGWIGPYNYGEKASAKHTWSSKGTYNVKVKAKDEFGAESVWSDPLAVSMPKVKQKDTFLVRILNWFDLNDFQIGIRSLKSFILNYLLDEKTINSFYQSIDEQSLWITNPTGIVATASFQDGGFTNVEIEGCNITVNLFIEIFGNGTEEQGGTVSANDIKTSIENFWNKNGDGQDWHIRCKEENHDCNATEPGCKVTFNVTVKNTAENENLSGHGNWSGTGYWKNNSSANGYHQIRIINNSGWRSVVYTWPPYNGPAGNWPPNNGTDPYSGQGDRMGGIWSSSASAKVYAHEAGHLMGLGDQYHDDANGVSVPNPGCETNIMASVSKCNETANASQVEQIVNQGGVYCPCKCCPEENDTTEPDVNIFSPNNGESTSSPINVTGSATDKGGSGIVELDYKLEWNGGHYDGSSVYFDPPEQEIGFKLGPLALDHFIEIGDWIKIIIYAIDDAGNIGSDDVTVTYIEDEEDNTPPVTVKIIGQPQDEGGYIIWPITPITLTATDDDSGVNHIHYDIWWDSNGDQIVDTQVASENIYNSFTTFTVGSYGVFYGLIQLKYYAVDNAQNQEQPHTQNHMVME